MVSGAYSTSTRAYTLIEVVAVVVLIGLFASAFAPGLARRSRSAQLEDFKSRLVEFDVLARQLALKGSRVTVRCELYAGTVRLIEQRDLAEEVRRIAVPVMVELQPIGFDTEVGFDANGCTQGYGFMIRTDSSVDRLAFHGISGWYEVTRDDR